MTTPTSTKSTKPEWKHAPDTREGRIERATYILIDGERRGMLVTTTLDYLKGKGCSDEEIMIALDQASGGALVEAALGGII